MKLGREMMQVGWTGKFYYVVLYFDVFCVSRFVEPVIFLMVCIYIYIHVCVCVYGCVSTMVHGLLSFLGIL